MLNHTSSTHLSAAAKVSGIVLTALCSLFSLNSQAEKIAVPLSQDQESGETEHACIYVHQGKAEIRRITTSSLCESSIQINSEE